MRTVLVTGPGGAGRTTLAAATALAAARAGSRTLLITPDRSAAAVLGVRPGRTPVEVAPLLGVVGTDPDHGFRSGLLTLQERAGTALALLGAAPLEDGELTTLPGAGELALLSALHRHGVGEDPARPDADEDTGPAHETLVVDLPAGDAALALLVLPEQLRRYLGRLLPARRQAARALRPVLGRLAGVPMPAEDLYTLAARADTTLAAVEDLLRAPGTTVRYVAEPTPAAADALRVHRTGTALYDLRPEAVLANRVQPEQAPGAAQQDKVLAEWRAEVLPVHPVRHLGHDPRGLDDLAALQVPPPAALPVEALPWPLLDRREDSGDNDGGGCLEWWIPLPGAVREELDLFRLDDELVVTAGPFRRVLILPSALRRCSVTGAALREGALRVRFTPDPALWPRR
ncbi:ArsA-related P-loop ATPase [Streptomyces sp. NPDC049954]|uniref:ArsA family ATPase n=1 Tax=Streptomyces sp. NPDC049954 TaxID=3155779 RepID=UPI003418D08D